MVTLVQDHFNKDADYIEKDDDGNTIALWADYYADSVLPDDYNPDVKPASSYGIITCTGKNEIKVGGSFKKLSINFFNKDGQPVEFATGTWNFSVDDEVVEPIISTVGLDENQIKIKLPTDDSLLINKVLTVAYVVTESGLRTTFEMSVVGL